MIFALTASAQIYSNAPFITGTVTKSGVDAPNGYQWSELQNDDGNTTEANGLIGFGCYTTFLNGVTNNIWLTDDFTVPAGEKWIITNASVFAYKTGAPATPSPFVKLFLELWDGDPSLPGSNLISGDITKDVLQSTDDTKVYRLANTIVPAPGTAPGTARLIWKNTGTLSATLTSGTYWLVWSTTDNANGSHFAPAVTIPGARTRPGGNAKQYNLTGWTAELSDSGNPTSAPDVTVDIPFELNGTKVDLAAVAGSSTVCAGSTVSLTAVPPDAAATYQYTWSAPEGFTLSATNTSEVTAAVSATLTGEHTFTVVATAGNSTTMTSTVSITVINNRILTQPAVSSVVCAGTNVMTTVTITGTATAYQWYKDAIPLGNQRNATLSLNGVTTADQGVYKLIIETTSCGSLTSTGFSLTVNLPTVSISPASTVINQGESVLLTASGADSYIWNTQATGNSITVSPDLTTTYSVTGTSSGCSGTASATVTLRCPPHVQAMAISVTQSSVLGAGNCSVILMGSGKGNLLQLTGPNGYIYSGVYRNAGTYTLNGLNVTQPGMYTFKVSNNDDCGRSSSDTRTYVVTGTACQ